MSVYNIYSVKALFMHHHSNVLHFKLLGAISNVASLLTSVIPISLGRCVIIDLFNFSLCN